MSWTSYLMNQVERDILRLKNLINYYLLNIYLAGGPLAVKDHKGSVYISVCSDQMTECCF